MSEKYLEKEEILLLEEKCEERPKVTGFLDSEQVDHLDSVNPEVKLVKFPMSWFLPNDLVFESFQKMMKKK